jgi:hypothetical protein
MYSPWLIDAFFQTYSAKKSNNWQKTSTSNTAAAMKSNCVCNFIADFVDDEPLFPASMKKTRS